MHPTHRGVWADGCSSGLLLFWLFLLSAVPLVIGPRPPGGPRNREDLVAGRVTGQTANIRQRLLKEFLEWAVTEDPSFTNLKAVARTSPVTVIELLEEFGKVLYEQGASRRNYAETINSVQQMCPFLRTMMVGPWQLVTTWETLHPSQLHPPIPYQLLLAMASQALGWKWHRMCLLLLLGFFALLRPAELCSLKVKHCVLSSLPGGKKIVVLQLMQTKSRTRGARHQSVRLDELFVISFLEKCFKHMQADELLWPHSASLFRTRFDQVLVAACGHSKLVYPSSLRPGGATYLFQLWDENIPKLQWRGRWLHLKTMLHYIQELGAINVLNQFQPSQTVRMNALASLCQPCLECVEVARDAHTLAHLLLVDLSK